MAKYIVTVAPPTPNGDLHLGHIAGPFLAGDIFARIRRQFNDEIVFLSYSDDYQDYVERKAIEKGSSKEDIFKRYSRKINNTLKNIDIHFDNFMYSYDNKHFKEAVKMFYENAKNKKLINSKEDNVPYLSSNNVYGYEAFARGVCNYCGTQSDPSQCEHCANAPIVEKMGQLKYVLNNQFFDKKVIDREFIKLNTYRQELLDLYQTKNLRKYLYKFIENVFKDDELHWFIDRPNSNGIDIEVNNEKKILSTWFSGIAGYYAATEELGIALNNNTLTKYFWEDSSTQIICFLGFDCSFSHTIVYPTLLMASEKLTTNIMAITNKFLKLEGGDFSTSRGHAIWVDEMLNDYPSDSLRFYLALHSPENNETNFELENFKYWHTTTYIPFIKKLASIEKENFPSTLVYENSILNELTCKWVYYTKAENFSIANIAKTCENFIFQINQLNDQKDITHFISVFLILSQSIIPKIAQQYIAKFNINEKNVWSQIKALDLVKDEI